MLIRMYKLLFLHTMPDCKCQQLLSINCQMTENPHCRRQMYKETNRISPNQSIAPILICIVAIKLFGKLWKYKGARHRSQQRGKCKNNIKIHHEYSKIFTGNECIKCNLVLQVIGDVNSHQVPIRCIAYTLQEP